MTRRPVGTVDLSTSGGRCELIGYTDDDVPAPAIPSLDGLVAYLDAPAAAGGLEPAGAGPYFAPGTVLTWHFRGWADVVRVVGDDERGLVCWLPSGAPRITNQTRDGALRELPLHRRFTEPRVPVLGWWDGPGILRVAPTGRPWSVWFFYGEDGNLLGWYVNLEVPHHRPAGLDPTSSDDARVHTRDLWLDLWLEGDEIWLKDEDELDAAVTSGVLPAELAETVRACGQWARVALGQEREWPMDAGFETFRPDAALVAHVELPDNPMTRATLAGIPTP